jgi:anthranilate synthase component I
MAIAIRSALLRNGKAYVQAGGGIVADSDNVAEAQESVNKAAAPLRAVHTASSLRSVTGRTDASPAGAAADSAAGSAAVSAAGRVPR